MPNPYPLVHFYNTKSRPRDSHRILCTDEWVKNDPPANQVGSWVHMASRLRNGATTPNRITCVKCLEMLVAEQVKTLRHTQARLAEMKRFVPGATSFKFGDLLEFASEMDRPGLVLCDGRTLPDGTEVPDMRELGKTPIYFVVEPTLFQKWKDQTA